MHIRHLLRHRGRLAATATAAVLPVSLAWAGMATAGTAPQPSQLPAIKHVWVIELENEGLSQSFGDRCHCVSPQLNESKCKETILRSRLRCEPRVAAKLLIRRSECQANIKRMRAKAEHRLRAA